MIQQLKRRDQGTREARARDERRSPAAAAASVVLHVGLAVVLWYALQVPLVLERILRPPPPPQAQGEQLRYVTVGPPTAPAPAAPGATAGPRFRPPDEQQQPSPPLVAPREVPSALPPVPAEPAPRAGPTGPVVGGQGPVKGAQPGFEDPRPWVPMGPLATAPKSPEQRLDSAVVTMFKAYQDSVVANSYSPNKFEKGNWTVEKNGKKYGIDQQYIHLGKFSIPTALLALLPLNMQGNPIQSERTRAQLAMRTDIMEHAAAAMNEEEFRRAVKEIRERKERERRGESPTVASTRRRERPVVAPSERPPD